MLKVRDQKGFTLIELLIVIAIIAILAAIAIPQFAEYRARGLESSMATDAKNAATAVESVFADCQTYVGMGFTSGTGAGNNTSTIGLAGAACPGNAAGSNQNIRVSTGNQLNIPGSVATTASNYSVIVNNPNARAGHRNVQVDQTGSLNWN